MIRLAVRISCLSMGEWTIGRTADTWAIYHGWLTHANATLGNTRVWCTRTKWLRWQWGNLIGPCWTWLEAPSELPQRRVRGPCPQSESEALLTKFAHCQTRTLTPLFLYPTTSVKNARVKRSTWFVCACSASPPLYLYSQLETIK